MSEIFSMKETAIGVHEFFESLCKAGFTRDEALQLVMNMIKGDNK
jgi:hypothetical protein